MPQLGRYARQLARLWKPPVEREVDSELAFHLEMRTQENIARGMEPEAARAEAVRRFGDVAEINATCRDLGRRRDDEMRRAEWIAELGQDLRYALRHLRANPGFAAVAVLTLALGIGASTSIFGIANAVLLRPLPFPEPGRLVRMYETNPTTQTFSASEPNYLDWRVRNRSFAELAAWTFRSASLIGSGEPEQLQAIAATHTFFRVLGATPLLGRTFLEEESRPGGSTRVAVLSYRLWQRRFGGDAGIIGRSIVLDGDAYQVVGVMPASFDTPGLTDVWVPLAPALTSPRADHRLSVIGRLKPGVTLAQASSDMAAVARQLAQQYPESNKDWGTNLLSFDDWIVGRQLRARVIVLLVAVGLLLLMACVNVANLLIARAVGRGRELSVRAALGAGRGRIVRQLLTESVALALIGAAVGVAFAAAAVPVLRRAGGTAVPRLDEMNVDWRVLAFGIAASLLTGVLFGLAPALQASRASLHDLLRSGARVAGAGGLRRALIVASVAMAMLLLVGAGLVGGSFLRLMRVDPGFRADGVLTASLSLTGERYDEAAQRVAFYADVMRRLASIPGVTAVGATNIAPFSGGSTAIPFTPEGRAPAAGEYLQANWRSVTPGYFAALRLPLRRGRLIAETDAESAPPIVVISETMARRIWPGEDPVGKQIRPQGNKNLWTVVGVVGDIRDQTLEQEPEPVMYLSYQQVAWPSMWLLVRTAGNPMSVANAVRREIWAVDKTLPVANVQPLSQLVTDVAAQPRLTMLVFALFAAAALTLAVVGVYGIVAYGVTQRTRELGVRLALGARPAQIVGLVVRHGVGLAALGIAIGLGTAYALSRYLASILFGVRPTDALTYAGVALVLAACAALASLIPARTAARLDPVLALRGD
jgi:putative ABC transport system permease protein